jgi:uncharacterized protein (TIGR03437 family)
VDFYVNNTFMGSDTTSPYTINWNANHVGNYNVTARATDNSGLVNSSSVVPVRVATSPASVIKAKDNASTLASGLINGPSTLRHHASNSLSLVTVSGLESLNADIAAALNDFAFEAGSFGSIAPQIGAHLNAAKLFGKANTALATKTNDTPSIVSHLQRIASHLAIAEDLMMLQTVSSATLARAANTRTRVNVAIGPATTGYGILSGSNLSPASIGAIVGNPTVAPLTAQTASAQLDAEGKLPYELAGITVMVGGQSVPVLYVSPSRISFYLPADAIVGVSDVIVASQDGFISQGVASVDKGGWTRIVTRDDNDNGFAAVVNSHKRTEHINVTTPENFGSDKRTRVSLFATGIVGSALNSNVANDVNLDGGIRVNYAESVTVEAQRADGQTFNLPVEFAGEQGGMPGLDQIEVVLIPQLQSAGAVKLTVIVNGKRSNAPTIMVN